VQAPLYSGMLAGVTERGPRVHANGFPSVTHSVLLRKHDGFASFTCIDVKGLDGWIQCRLSPLDSPM
jgi:hypothetical protein